MRTSTNSGPQRDKDPRERYREGLSSFRRRSQGKGISPQSILESMQFAWAHKKRACFIG